ncbi:tRNA (N6-isopentenyl adenosine(37)-C2)-methylthiotransferase MiaB [Candidatus Uhrbacteria bacterium]|nr:tRNA (N6-isopentenyl adenosine(37)-C2)-methylthiotransferase MiaB [Candidatus Uhrbacteria bacterium]
MNAGSQQPKFHLVTYGCQMNKNDSERIAGVLANLGFIETEDESVADVILFNTCSVRQTAEERVYGKMEDMIKLKQKRPEVIVAVTGCMAGRDKKQEFKAKMDPVDLYFPTPQMVHLPRWIAELRPDLVNSDSLEVDYLKLQPLRVPSAQAFVTIQTGCNKFCTYCVVPYARGMERNRPAKDILNEIRDLVEHGVVEITLLGQTVNSYKAPDQDCFSVNNPYVRDYTIIPSLQLNHFAELLWEIQQIPGLERLHWTAPHPNSMTDEVIDALCLPKQVNYLHLPVQAGSTAVLSRMNRKYTREQFLHVIQKIKAKRPGIALGTDIIVGFPGETADQFDETVSLYRECDFDISYTAQYSPRSGTLGVKLFQDDVPKEEKKRRWGILQSLMEETTKRKNQAYIGKTVSVLVDAIKNGTASGNSNEMKRVSFPVKEGITIGSIVLVQIRLAMEWQLLGEVIL